jgi:hypothetical protein
MDDEDARISGSWRITAEGPIAPAFPSDDADAPWWRSCLGKGRFRSPGVVTKCTVVQGKVRFGEGAQSGQVKQFELSPDAVITHNADEFPHALTLEYHQFHVLPTNPAPDRKVTLYGMAPQDVRKWKQALEEERDDVSHLPLGSARADFSTMLRAELWTLFYSGATSQPPNTALRRLYYKNWRAGGELLLNALLGRYTSMMQRTGDPLTQQDAMAFAEMLGSAVLDSAVRVALLRLQLNEDALPTFARMPAATPADFAAFVGELEVRVKAWSSWNRELFLSHHKYPVLSSRNGKPAKPTKMCDEEELHWFTTENVQDGQLSLEEFTALTSSSCAFELARRYAQRSDTDALSRVIEAVPKDELQARAFPSLLFILPSQHQPALLNTFTRAGVVDLRFYESLFDDGLTDARVQVLHSFVSKFLFGEAESGAFRPVVVAQLTTALQGFPVALLKAIYRAMPADGNRMLNYEHDRLRGLLEILFRFEQDVDDPSWSTVMTLSRWLKPGAEQWVRIDMLQHVLASTAFPSFLSHLYGQNRALWPDSRGRETSVPFGPVNSVPLRNWFTRTKVEFSALMFGVFKVGLHVDSGGGMRVLTSLLSKLEGWETTFMGAAEPLRLQVVDALAKMPAFVDIYDGDGNGFLALMRSGVLLSTAMHFDGAVLKACCLPLQIAADSDAHLVFELLALALQFQQWADLESSVRDVWRRMCVAEDRKSHLARILMRVRRRLADVRGKADFFAPGASGRPDERGLVTIADLDECARYATEATRMLPQAALQDKMIRLFDFYLKSNTPTSWRDSFKSASTVAFFLKYLHREDLDKAYESFERANAGNALFASHIDRVKETFRRPVLTSEEVQLTGADVIQTFISKLSSTGQSNSDRLLGLLQQISAEWMTKTYTKLQSPMAPRNAQLIAFLLCTQWAKLRLRNETPDEQRTLIMRVGTGEGKSLIIAMVAIFVVKMLRKKVHVLESNDGLLSRDYADFADFFANLGVTTSSNDFSAGADVTYCLKKQLNMHYRDNVGRDIFYGTVLIVDEVDALIVDEDPNTKYVRPDAERSKTLPQLFSALKRGRGNAPELAGDPMYPTARSAYKSAQAMLLAGENKPNGYAILGTDFKKCDSNGAVQQGAYSLALVYLCYERFGTVPKAQTYFFYQSTPHMLKQYAAIVGLSGSLGSPAEKAFLADTYNARTIEVPPFLDTCLGVSKTAPALVDDSVLVLDNERAHIACVVATALRHRCSAPVVILCAGPQAARNVLQSFTAADTASGHVQLLLEYENGARMNYEAVLEKATQSVGSGNAKRWTVTVSDLFGGRGQDYLVPDQDVDDAGGLLVIAASFPASEREWVQWIGRTARNDRRGRYAVILNRQAEAPSFSSWLHEHHLAGTAYKRTLLTQLLSCRDELCKIKLLTQRANLVSGMQMNEMCDAFWTKADGVSASWPANAEQAALRELLASKQVFTLDDVLQFAVSNGLAISREQYMQTSAYCASGAAQ